MKIRHALAASATVILGFSTLAPTPSVAAERSADRQPTSFAMQASGYGSKVRGGDVPVGSGDSAYTSLGCTNQAGISRQNHEAQLTVPSVGVLSGVKTKVWTVKTSHSVSSYARHTIANLTLAETPAGSLSLSGITSVSRAYHNATGFHAATATDVVSIILTPATGPPQTFPAPTPGTPLVVPGVAIISVGQSITDRDAAGAQAAASALRVSVLATDTQVVLAHTTAGIGGGVKSAVFGGSSYGSRVQALDDNLTSGRTPLLLMPCQGTQGQVKQRNLADLNLDDTIRLTGLQTKQSAEQTRTKASGFEEASIARLNLGDGQLVVTAIVGRASVDRSGGHIARNAAGTSLGKVMVNGERQHFPDTDTLKIPGVAKLQRNIISRTKTGISVTALRITVLDGTGAVINLGHAEIRAHTSGL